MKNILIITLLFVTFFNHAQNDYKELFGDSIKEFQWSCSMVYLPSPNSEAVFIKAEKNKITANYNQYRWRRTLRRKSRTRLRISKNDFVAAYDLYAELKEPVTDFVLTSADKDSMRAFIKEKNWKDQLTYKLSEDQLEQYLIKDTLAVDMKVFEMDSLNDLLTAMVIDGAPFRFQMRTITVDDDTTVFNYDGNLFGGDRYRDLPKYLMFITLNSNTKFYNRLPMDDYFSRSNFLRTILRYLEGKEGLLEFKPFEIQIEDR